MIIVKARRHEWGNPHGGGELGWIDAVQIWGHANWSWTNLHCWYRDLRVRSYFITSQWHLESLGLYEHKLREQPLDVAWSA